MNKREWQANQFATQNAKATSQDGFLAGIEFALDLASGLVVDLTGDEKTGILFRAIGTAEVNPETGKPLGFE